MLRSLRSRCFVLFFSRFSYFFFLPSFNLDSYYYYSVSVMLAGEVGYSVHMQRGNYLSAIIITKRTRWIVAPVRPASFHPLLLRPTRDLLSTLLPPISFFDVQRMGASGAARLLLLLRWNLNNGGWVLVDGVAVTLPLRCFRILFSLASVDFGERIAYEFYNEIALSLALALQCCFFFFLESFEGLNEIYFEVLFFWNKLTRCFEIE